MGENIVKNIRETKRRALNIQRKEKRNDESDVRRQIDIISTVNVQDIVNRLKTKASITVKELKILKNELLDDGDNIEVLLNTNGALRGLIREFTGSDVAKQLAAAACLCNLALGNPKACGAVSKAAGTYLVASLDSLSTELSVTCAWAIGNLAGADPRVCQILAAQGAFVKLCQLLATSGDENKEAAAYALTHIAFQMQDGLGSELVLGLTTYITKVPQSTECLRFLFILSCHKDFVFNECLVLKLLSSLSLSLEEYSSMCNEEKKRIGDLIYVLRILANMVLNDYLYEKITDYLFSNGCGNHFRAILLSSECDNVKDSLHWFLGNLFVFSEDDNMIFDLIE